MGGRLNHTWKGPRSGWTLKHGQEHPKHRERSRRSRIQRSPGVEGEAAPMSSSDSEGISGQGLSGDGDCGEPWRPQQSKSPGLKVENSRLARGRSPCAPEGEYRAERAARGERMRSVSARAGGYRGGKFAPEESDSYVCRRLRGIYHFSLEISKRFPYFYLNREYRYMLTGFKQPMGYTIKISLLLWIPYSRTKALASGFLLELLLKH